MIDHVKDKNLTYLYNLDKTEGLPDFVKQAGLLREDDATRLGSNLFADSNNRSFPTHTKPDTWLSSAYFEKFAKDQYSDEILREKVAAKLRDMCSFWGIDYPAPHVQKEASVEVGIEYRYDGVPQKTVMVKTASQMNEVARFVTDNPGKLPWEMRREAARQILDKRASFSNAVEEGLLEALHKTAGYGVGEVHDVVHEIRKRQTYLGKMQGKEGAMQLQPLIELAREASQNGIVEPDALDKIAATVDAVDKMLDLSHKYGHDLRTPEEAFFTFSVEDADLLSKEAVQLPSGQIVSDTFLNDYSVRSFMGEFLGATPESGHAKEAAAQLTPRQSAKVYNFLQKEIAV
jgi:hypothetical protein